LIRSKGSLKARLRTYLRLTAQRTKVTARLRMPAEGRES
jgi:hypothetical protein